MSTNPDSESVEKPTTPAPKPENPNVATLKAAFPDVDPAVISAVLIASSNNLEKAFDGLLGMSDPDFKPETPVVSAPVEPTTEEQRQILADEQFARQLAAQHSSRRSGTHDYTSRYTDRERQAPKEPEHSFMDDDLPVLKENLIQGFNETKLKVGSFISNLRQQYEKRMENPGTGYDGERTQQPDVYHQNPRSSTQYDRDARTLDDDFDELHMEDNTKSPTGISIPGKQREQVDELAHSAGIGPSKATPSSSRWQPIAASPAKDNKTASKQDTFALGDDDDE
ncbi:protein of unknown function [Taphrina deformans PYCC 5710]|uniref:CUE domain-containing protein n=1 Tax=Taphrina deformans (strain PYCC 5710 / ATCC 11124 / CBS 356.35 / IMI 108563 / JCM 9778 / NBRC 8474) TaxID=1097556 RepID=R4XN63_TAPDE|nr:protein of unknown function [Taphrina deformans PYCC 5710]|eukprot:CCG84684.1 protein of unknown function [Taphrina deformans PYCC 5710]